jgi:hypothetical protein
VIAHNDQPNAAAHSYGTRNSKTNLCIIIGWQRTTRLLPPLKSIVYQSMRIDGDQVVTKCGDFWAQISASFLAQKRNSEKKISEGHTVNNACTYISLIIITCQYRQYWEGKLV